MSMGTFAFVLVTLTITFYFIALAWFMRRGWVIRGALAMTAIALVPVFWQAWFTDSHAPGFVFLLMMMLPLPALLLVGGLIAAVIRFYRRRTAEREVSLG